MVDLSRVCAAIADKPNVVCGWCGADIAEGLLVSHWRYLAERGPVLRWMHPDCVKDFAGAGRAPGAAEGRLHQHSTVYGNHACPVCTPVAGAHDPRLPVFVSWRLPAQYVGRRS